jgi:hypothetical protein
VYEVDQRLLKSIETIEMRRAHATDSKWTSEPIAEQSSSYFAKLLIYCWQMEYWREFYSLKDVSVRLNNFD